MSLLETRQQFVRISGRYDLVVDGSGGDWSDNGADFYINAGVRMLDQKIETKLSESVFYKKVQQGMVGLGLPDCRAVREVWTQNLANDARQRLVKRDRKYFRDKWKTQFQNIDQGPPLDYYLPTLRVVPDTITINQIESYIGWMDSQPSRGNVVYNGILWLPPLDDEYVLEVIGLFYTPKLLGDSDENFWTRQYPMEVVWAALWSLEVSYRNSEGAKDWEAAISGRLLDIDKDNVEEVIAGVSQMEG